MDIKKETVDQQILDFLEHLEVERNCSRLTIRNYHHYLNRFSKWYKDMGEQKIAKLDMNLIRKYRLYLSRFADDTGKELSAVTQSYHIIALRSFLKWLIKNDLQVLAPEKIDLPKVVSRSIKFLTNVQVDAMMEVVDFTKKYGLRDRAILEVLFSTGLRVSELVKLDREKINFESREFGVIGKGGKARVVFLSDRAASWLKRYFNGRDDNWKPAFIRMAKNKIPTKAGGEDLRITTRSVQRIVERYRKKAMLPVAITPHGLRHSFATDLLFHGAGLREVQEMLGHKNVGTTQIYTHVTQPQLKKVHDKFHSGNKK